MDTENSIEIDGMPLPALLIENFEKAERNLRDIYGRSPAAPELLRLWIAKATSWEIQAEFEHAILRLKSSMAQPNKEGQFDEDSFEF